MVAWFNDNQGFALVILTLVYVIATLVIVVIMARSNHLARESLRQSVELDRERSRPYIVFDIELANHVARLVLKNIGATPAIDVTVQVEPPITGRGKGEKRSGLLGRTIKFMAPGREFSDFVDSSPNFIKAHPDAQFRGRLAYFDTRGKKYTDSFHIDLNFQKDLAYIARKDIGRELEGIKDRLEKISNSVSRLG